MVSALHERIIGPCAGLITLCPRPGESPERGAKASDHYLTKSVSSVGKQIRDEIMKTGPDSTMMARRPSVFGQKRILGE